MRIAIPHGGRESPLDRRIGRVWANMEPTPREPHPYTVRWEIYVPAGELLYVEYIHARVMRDDWAYECGEGELSIIIVGPGACNVHLVYVALHSNVRYEYKESTLTPGIILEPGERIQCVTGDGSSGGTICYWGEVIGFRFAP